MKVNVFHHNTFKLVQGVLLSISEYRFQIGIVSPAVTVFTTDAKIFNEIFNENRIRQNLQFFFITQHMLHVDLKVCRCSFL